MAFIEIVLLQSPKIMLNSVPCQLPYQKAEALLYFLAVEKETTREQAASLLWDSCEESAARKNLRHAIYTIKKTMGVECIVSKGRQELILNPELSVQVDYDRLVKEEQAGAYQGEFLKGFYIKGALPFEDWMLTKRALVLNAYLKLLSHRLSLLSASDLEEAELLFSRYLAEDALDESVYQLMLELYKTCGLYYKGIKLYQQLSSLMDKELSAKPGREITRLYGRLLRLSKNERPLFEKYCAALSGHEQEMEFLDKSVRLFLNGNPMSILLTGEDGSGKTYLAKYFAEALSDQSFLVLQASCLETEQSVLLKPLAAMAAQLPARIESFHLKADSARLEAVSRLFPLSGAFDDSACRLLLELLSGLAAQSPLALIFDNIHFMDFASLAFVSLLVRSQNPNILFLGTAALSGPDSLKPVIQPLLKENLLLSLKVSCVGKKQTEPNKSLTSFLGPEPTSGEILKNLPLLEKSVLELLSACQSGASLELFEDLLGKDPMELLDALELLKKLEIIEERGDQKNACFLFRHNAVRKKIYEQMSPSRRAYFHRALAEHLKHLSKFGASDYECLIFHYCRAGNPALELKYRILALEEYTYRNYELYPLQYSQEKRSEKAIPSVTGYCDTLEDRLLSLTGAEAASIRFSWLYALLLRTKAQYCIAQGKYKEGLLSLKKALQLNRQDGNEPLMRVRCLRLINFYRLNIWNIQDLESSLSECLQLGKEGGYEEDYAIDCRLYGLFQAMVGKYASSIRYFKRALRIFSLNPLKSRVYTLNIAGCYNYMGESYRKQKQFERAIRFYQKAIQTCAAGHNSGNAVFYSNLGRAQLALGNLEESARAFYFSNRLYDESAALIGRSITKGYVSILEAEKNNFDYARMLFTEAEKSALLLASPNSIGLLALASWELRLRWPREFSGLLPKKPELYKKEAKMALKNIPGAYEVEG